MIISNVKNSRGEWMVVLFDDSGESVDLHPVVGKRASERVAKQLYDIIKQGCSDKVQLLVGE
jgi:hypothetical protein